MENEEQNNPSWLQRVQEQSWEPEILISGIVLFALFQIPSLIEDAADYLNTYTVTIFTDGNVDETLAAILLSATYWLILGFTTHLISRSIWAAFVGLSYVYRDGIKLEELKYGDKYKRIIAKSLDYKDMIVRIEKFCSGVFAVSFLLFMCVVGVSFFLLIVGAIIAILLEVWPEFTDHDHWIDPILMTIMIVYLIDFLSLGLLKRIPVVNKIYYPFYRVMSVLTISPLYRSIYYGIVSNHKKWKVALGMSVFVTLTIFIAISIKNEAKLFSTLEMAADSGPDYIFPGNYRNLANGSPSKRFILESDVIDKNVAKVFLVSGGQLAEESIAKGCDYEKYATNEKIDLDSLKMECLKNFYKLELDGEEIHPDYFYFEERSINREGLMAYVDLSFLPRGMHEFKLYLKFIEDGEVKERLRADAEFFKNAPQVLTEPENKGPFQSDE
jgi:hypothetical protein